jgi:hypothetical protein
VVGDIPYFYIYKNMKNKIISGISLGIILHWVSLFLSTQKILNADDMYGPCATGGFPLKIYEYPYSPMGNDHPPIDTWPIFFLNLLIWIILGLLISLIFNKKFEDKKIIKILIITAIIMSMIGKIFLLIKFD